MVRSSKKSTVNVKTLKNFFVRFLRKKTKEKFFEKALGDERTNESWKEKPFFFPKWRMNIHNQFFICIWNVGNLFTFCPNRIRSIFPFPSLHSSSCYPLSHIRIFCSELKGCGLKVSFRKIIQNLDEGVRVKKTFMILWSFPITMAVEISEMW